MLFATALCVYVCVICEGSLNLSARVVSETEQHRQTNAQNHPSSDSMHPSPCVKPDRLFSIAMALMPFRDASCEVYLVDEWVGGSVTASVRRTLLSSGA